VNQSNISLEEFQLLLESIGLTREFLVSQLGALPEQILFDLLREILLILHSREALSTDESPKKRALGYLYTLSRAVESLGRFPTPEETGFLLESSRYPDLGGWKNIQDLLKNRAASADSKQSLRKLRERRRKYR
jgi:hypothetical protein